MKEEKKQSEIILYKTDDGEIKTDIIIQNETIWLTQAQRNELDESTVYAKFAYTAAEQRIIQYQFYMGMHLE